MGARKTEAALKDRSKLPESRAPGRLLQPSGRGDVPPFMVMDVMAAAARIEEAGGQVIHMEVGQPAAPAPQTAIAAAKRRPRPGPGRLHGGPRHPAAARPHRAALPGNLRR
jgi:hypothetical protein